MRFCKTRVFLLAPALLALLPCSAQHPLKSPSLPGKEEVLRAIGLPELAHDPHLQLQTKPWRARPGSFVALVFFTSPSNAIDDGTEVVRTPRLQPTLILLEPSNGHLVASAQSDITTGTGEECRELSQVEKSNSADEGVETDGDFCKELNLDLAPYRITSTEIAIGVRTKYHGVYPAGESDSEGLALFQVAGNRLAKIFSENMQDSSEERGPNEMLSSTNVLRVGPTKTAGHFDLVLVRHNRVEPLLDDAGSPPPKSTLEKRKFVWNGSAYKEAK